METMETKIRVNGNKGDNNGSQREHRRLLGRGKVELSAYCRKLYSFMLDKNTINILINHFK